MKISLTTFALSGLMLAAASPALADANAGIAELKANNLIVLGDLNNSSEVEGRTFVGGALTGNSSNYFILNGKSAPASTAPGLTVVGNITGGTKNLNNGSGAAIGGDELSGLNLNGGNQTISIFGSAHDINGSNGSQISITGASVLGNYNANGATLHAHSNLTAFKAGLTAEKSAYATDLTDLSSYLASLTPTDTATVSSNVLHITPLASASTIAVFDLTAAFLSTASEISVAPGAFDTIIINVDGSAPSLSQNFIGAASGLGQKVIWNFFDATSIHFGNAFYGSVLAPGAAATTGNFIEGSAVFGSLVENGEFHLNGYEGHLTATPPTAPGVPEPATWALMIGGFGLAGAALRRRRTALA